ncbi:hypothetical protein HGRIS_001739 [Hohenbuehelia grisea]|uniref:Uncharacterized protein n=1 Tax=Hohenbuehelia grisea TaxID=104357 RepID=A0ABR3JJ58_9AGAR
MKLSRALCAFALCAVQFAASRPTSADLQAVQNEQDIALPLFKRADEPEAAKDEAPAAEAKDEAEGDDDDDDDADAGEAEPAAEAEEAVPATEEAPADDLPAADKTFNDEDNGKFVASTTLVVQVTDVITVKEEPATVTHLVTQVIGLPPTAKLSTPCAVTFTRTGPVVKGDVTVVVTQVETTTITLAAKPTVFIPVLGVKPTPAPAPREEGGTIFVTRYTQIPEIKTIEKVIETTTVITETVTQTAAPTGPSDKPEPVIVTVTQTINAAAQPTGLTIILPTWFVHRHEELYVVRWRNWQLRVRNWQLACQRNILLRRITLARLRARARALRIAKVRIAKRLRAIRKNAHKAHRRVRKVSAEVAALRKQVKHLRNVVNAARRRVHALAIASKKTQADPNYVYSGISPYRVIGHARTDLKTKTTAYNHALAKLKAAVARSKTIKVTAKKIANNLEKAKDRNAAVTKNLREANLELQKELNKPIVHGPRPQLGGN